MDLDQLLRSGAYQQARAEAERLLRIDGTAAGDRARFSCIAAKAALELDEPYAAVALAEKAIDGASELGDRLTAARATVYAGIARIKIGDPVAAERHLVAALLDLPAELRDWEGPCHLNLSIAYRQMRQWEGALETLQQASEAFLRDGQLQSLAQAQLDVAWVHCMTGRPELASAPLDQVASYLGQNEAHELAADLLCTRALQAWKSGRRDDAAYICRDILAPGRPGVGDHQLGETFWLLGEIALDCDQLQLAGPMIDQAFRYAARDGWPTLMNLVGDLRYRYETLVTARVPHSGEGSKDA